jgi:hypothetical protein
VGGYACRSLFGWCNLNSLAVSPFSEGRCCLLLFAELVPLSVLFVCLNLKFTLIFVFSVILLTVACLFCHLHIAHILYVSWPHFTCIKLLSTFLLHSVATASDFVVLMSEPDLCVCVGEEWAAVREYMSSCLHSLHCFGAVFPSLLHPANPFMVIYNLANCATKIFCWSDCVASACCD